MLSRKAKLLKCSSYCSKHMLALIAERDPWSTSLMKKNYSQFEKFCKHSLYFGIGSRDQTKVFLRAVRIAMKIGVLTSNSSCSDRALLLWLVQK